jgi:hypothetical protein
LTSGIDLKQNHIWNFDHCFSCLTITPPPPLKGAKTPPKGAKTLTEGATATTAAVATAPLSAQAIATMPTAAFGISLPARLLTLPRGGNHPVHGLCIGGSKLTNDCITLAPNGFECEHTSQ